MSLGDGSAVDVVALVDGGAERLHHRTKGNVGLRTGRSVGEVPHRVPTMSVLKE